MKRFKQWRSTTISNLRKTCPRFNLAILFPGHVDHNSSLTFFYIYLYIFLYEICFFFEVGKKRPRVFEEGGSFDKSQACSLPRSTTKKSVWCFFFVKSVFMSLIIYLSRGAPPTLGSIRSWSPAASRFVSISLFWRKVEREGEQQWRGESGGRRHQQCLRCGLSEASCCPGPPRPYPPSHRERCSRVRGKQIRRWGFVS